MKKDGKKSRNKKAGTEAQKKVPRKGQGSEDQELKVACPEHVRFKRWKKEEAISELEALRAWLSDGDPFKISFEGFAASRGYSRQRISEWPDKWKKDRQVQELYQICRDLQANKYMVGGLTHRYSSRLTQFGLINCCGMKSISTMVHEGIPEPPRSPEKAPESVREYLDRVTGSTDATDK